MIPEQLGSPNPIDAVLQNLRSVAFVCEGNQEVLTSIEVPIQTQHSYTVADGTQSSSNSPIYTGYSDNFLRNQVIYPASMLSDMEGAEISGSTGTSAQRFLTHSDPSYTALYNSGGSLSLSNPGSGYRVSYRDNLRLRGQCISGGCDRANVAVTDITDSTALLHFTAGDGASGIELQFKRAVDSAFTALTATGNTLQLTGLYHNTKYIVRVRSLCGDSQSNWKEVNFTTPAKLYPRIYVSVGGTGDGGSWATAAGDLNWAVSTAGAIRSAFEISPEVWVAAGTYYGNTSSGYAFSMVPGVNVYGGFAGNEPADYDLSQRDFQTNTTILDGQNARRVLVQTSNFTAATAATWDGFTIQNGRFAGYGAGVYMQQYSTLSHCIVQNNTIYYSSSTGESVTQFGAGVFSYISLSDGMRPNIISDCIIRNNSFEANSNLHGRGAGLCTMGTKLIRTEICYNGDSQYYVRFVDPVNGDFRLQPTSSCINAGNSSATIGEFDFYGNPRLNGTVDIGCDEASCNINELVEVTTCNSYTWNDITYTASGEYVQTFALPNGCDSVVTLHLTITVGIDDHDLTGMEIFPNPTSTVLNIKGENMRKIWIYNADGKIVFVKEENVGNLQRVDVSPFAAGQYIVEIELDNSRTVSRKFIVNRR